MLYALGTYSVDKDDCVLGNERPLVGEIFGTEVRGSQPEGVVHALDFLAHDRVRRNLKKEEQ